MSSTIKTTANDGSVDAFINAIADETKRQDSLRLLEMYQAATGERPRLWGTSIIGFGAYHYKSERSRQEGDWPLVSFSPRKQNLTLYFMTGFDGYGDLLARLGKHKTSKGCLYINKLADIDTAVLKTLISTCFQSMRQAH